MLYAARRSGTELTVTPWLARYPDIQIVTVPGRHRGPLAYLRAENVGPLAADLTTRLTAARPPR